MGILGGEGGCSIFFFGAEIPPQEFVHVFDSPRMWGKLVT